MAQLRTLPQSVQAVITAHERARTTESPEYQQAIGVFYERFLTRNSPPIYVEAYMKEKGLSFAPTVYNGMWGAGEIFATGVLRDYDGEALLDLLNVPTLVLCGEFDEMSPRAAKPFTKRIKNARFVEIRGSGHMTPFDQPVLYVQAVREHIASADPVSKARS